MSAASLGVLCADIPGSARLFERLPEGEALYAQERCLKRIERVVAGFAGRLLRSSGNELVASFENGEVACQAAVDMQQRVEDLPPVSGVKLSIRVGVHCGVLAPAGAAPAGDGFVGAARLLGMAKAGQIFVSAEAANALPVAMRQGTRATDRQMSEAGAGGAIYELPWQEAGELTVLRQQLGEVRASTTQMGSPKLCVRHSGKAFLLDGKNEGLSFGRDGACDVVIQDKRASRSHARILRRRDRYVLVDESTNGTYVAFEGEPEMFVRHSEVVLGNKGLLAFGHSATGGDAEVAEFEYL